MIGNAVRRLLAIVSMSMLGLGAIAAPPPLQSPDASRKQIEPAVTVTVAGSPASAIRVDSVALAAYPRTTVSADDHGTAGEWQGVALIDLLKAAGAPSGDTLRGAALRRYVRIDAADGYAVVFALAELDAKFSDDTVILADTRDGRPMSVHEGPFRIIAGGDKRPGRWVRQVTAITVLEASEAH